jgi:hypothetical protein
VQTIILTMWFDDFMKYVNSTVEKWEPRQLSWYSYVFDFQQGSIFLLSMASRLPLGPTQPPIQWVLGSVSLGVKSQGNKADHSPPSSAEVKRGGAIPPLLLMPSCLSTGTTLPFSWRASVINS